MAKKKITKIEDIQIKKAFSWVGDLIMVFTELLSIQGGM